MNQATPSLRWLNSEPKCKNKKWTVILTPWLLSHVVLNLWIMVCSELIAHRLMKCISLQRPNHHIRRGQSLLILTACVWNEKRLSLLFLSHSKKGISLAVPFWAWIIFFHEKSRLRSHPTLGASENFNEKRWKSGEKAEKAKESKKLKC
jgi:hypothetical protein